MSEKEKKERSIYFKAFAITAIVISTITFTIIGIMLLLGMLGMGGLIGIGTIGTLIMRHEKKDTTIQEKSIDQHNQKLILKKNNPAIKKKQKYTNIIYKWYDKNGNVKYSNVPIKGAVRYNQKNPTRKAQKSTKKLQRVKRKKYKVYLKNGMRIYCYEIIKMKNGKLALLERNMKTILHKNDVKKIETIQRMVKEK
ncbi:MAG: DUF4124 domain-containing protein [Candidatus Electrothrix sp. AW2]|nr:DUF4124 domain-containing protein [Candidatus Electrothrix gigas]